MVTQAFISKVLKNLLAKKYIEIEKLESDSRYKQIKITTTLPMKK